MSLKTGSKFQIKIIGDGSDTNISFLMATAPIVFIPPGDVGDFSGGFSLASILPSNVISVSSPGHTITSASISGLGTIMNLTFSAALGNGEEALVSGALVF